MASSLSPIVAPAGVQASTPFVGNVSGGDVVFVKQTSPPVVISTPLVHINTTTTPPQIQIGPFSSALGVAQIPGATVIGSGATGTAGGLGNIVVIGTNAAVAELQDSVAIGNGAGTGAVHGGAGAVAIGAGAAVGGAGSNAGGGVAVGPSAVANNGVAIGQGATCLLGQVAIGFGATAQALGVAVGGAAAAFVGGAHGDGAVALGASATARESSDIVIGTGNTGTASGGGGNIMLGSGVGGTGVQGHDSICIGSGSNNGGVSALPASATAAGVFATVIGGNSQAQHSGARLIGRGLTSTAANQTLIGGTDDPAATVIFGNGAVAAIPQNVVVGATGGSGTNVAGASHTIAGGISTGTAVGGSIVFQTTPASGVSSATPNALATALTIDSTQTCTFANAPIVPTVAGAAAGTGTLTNLPTGAAGGNPQLYLVFKTSTHTYAIPAWQTA